MPSLAQMRTNYHRPAHPTSFAGITNLKKHYNISTRRAKQVLSGIPTYSLHREAKRPIPRNPIYVYRKREHVQIDLIDVSEMAGTNDGITFILTGIDMFTKFLVCVPMLRKTAARSKTAMKKLLQKFGPDKPEKIMSDKGTEFMNNRVQELLQSQGIHHYTPDSDMKCPGIERVNKTIQRKIYQYMTFHKTFRYIDVLDDLVSSYNATPHRSIEISPREAELPENHLLVRDRLMSHYFDILMKKKKPVFKVGDIVRVSVLRSKFHRSYREQNTRDIFEIIRVDNTMPIPRYYLRCLKDLETITGLFYSNELTLYDVKEHEVERVVRSKRLRGVMYDLVKWVGYHERYNEWVPRRRIRNRPRER